MRLGRALCALATAGACGIMITFGEAAPPFSSGDNQPAVEEDSGREMAPEAQVMVDRQTALAASCRGSKYAHVCVQDSIMLFTQSMIAGSCSPVGCFGLQGQHKEGAKVVGVEEESARDGRRGGRRGEMKGVGGAAASAKDVKAEKVGRVRRSLRFSRIRGAKATTGYLSDTKDTGLQKHDIGIFVFKNIDVNCICTRVVYTLKYSS